MILDDDPTTTPDPQEDPLGWPIVSPSDIVVAEWDWDLAYMGIYLRLEICNRSPYLVREAILRIDGKGPGPDRVVVSRWAKVGPLFPGVYVHEEVGLSAQGGISGVSFETVKINAVRMAPDSQLMSPSGYPDLTAEVTDVETDEDAPDLRRHEDGDSGKLRTAVATNIRIRVCNSGPETVALVRLKLTYSGPADEWEDGTSAIEMGPVAEWILDMPRKEWNPYRLPDQPSPVCDPADPLLPGRAHEFTLVHYGEGPHGWAGRTDTTAIAVVGLKLRERRTCE